MPELFKLFSIFLMAMVKYFYSPFYAFATGENFWLSYVVIVSGGITSFSFFYYISTFVNISTKFVKPFLTYVISEKYLEKVRRKRSLKKSRRRKFTKRNRMIMKFKNSGMFLVIFLTPVLLSLPVGAYILNKYFKNNKLAFPGAVVAIVVEGFILCLLVWRDIPFI